MCKQTFMDGMKGEYTTYPMKRLRRRKNFTLPGFRQNRSALDMLSSKPRLFLNASYKDVSACILFVVQYEMHCASNNY